MIKRKYVLAVILFGTLWSCALFDVPDLTHTRAQIAGITTRSDTSVVVNIQVLKKSSAWSCEFSISIYPVSSPSGGQWLIITNVCDLEKHYEVVVGGLQKNVPYYFRLSEYVTFDLGGRNQTSGASIGERVEYTIKD